MKGNLARRKRTNQPTWRKTARLSSEHTATDVGDRQKNGPQPQNYCFRPSRCMKICVSLPEDDDIPVTIFPHHQPHVDILRGVADHPLCADHHGQAAHSAHHRHGAGRRADRKIRPQHPATRQFVRVVRQGGRLLHHVLGGPGNGHAGNQEQQIQVSGIRAAHVQRPLRHHAADRGRPVGLHARRGLAAGLHHGQQHAHRLPHREPLRIAEETQRDAECRVEHAVAAAGTDRAGGHRGLARRRRLLHRLLVAFRREVLGLLHGHDSGHSTAHPLVSATLQRRRHAVHLHSGHDVHERSPERADRPGGHFRRVPVGPDPEPLHPARVAADEPD